MPILLRSTVMKMTMMSVLISAVTGCGPSGRDLSDREWLDLQRDMQSERTQVGLQRDALESDRREFNARERSDPILAATISSSALLLCCCLPLLLIAILLWPRRPPVTDQDVRDAWIDDVVIPFVEETSTTRRLATADAANRITSTEE